MSPVFPRSAPLCRLGAAAFMTLAPVTAACGEGGGGDLSTGPGPGTETPAGGIVGVYQLASVNGNPLTLRGRPTARSPTTSTAATSS
jgi:hypothetical protein